MKKLFLSTALLLAASLNAEVLTGPGVTFQTNVIRPGQYVEADALPQHESSCGCASSSCGCGCF